MNTEHLGKEDLAKPFLGFSSGDTERIIEIPEPTPEPSDVNDDFEEDYNDFDDYPFDLELDFNEHPDIADELEFDEDRARFVPWGF